jgi:asparagine synthase (glutamine-hydrolysing)
MKLRTVQSTATMMEQTTASAFLPLGWLGGEELFQGESTQLVVDGFFGIENDPFAGETRQTDDDVARRAVQLYQTEGALFLRRLRGSFAIALWDPRKRQLILATDHLGTRPLYVWSGNGRLAFAPRIHDLTDHAEVPKRIDPNSLYFYLNHSFIPAPVTIYQDIQRLEPGHCLIWENGKISIVRYWDMSYPEDVRLDEKAAADLLRSSVEESMRFLLRSESYSNRELGAFLSGGTDSSTVVGLMSRITGERIHSFSVGFDEMPYNEIHFARVAAAHFNSQIHEYFVRPKEALKELPVIVRAFDEPFGNSSAIPTYFCVKAAREAGVKLMFTGDGGDELYGGNERYLTEKVFSVYHRIPDWLKKGTDFTAGLLPAVYPWRKVKNFVRKANLHCAERFFDYQLYYRKHADDFFADEFRAGLSLDFPLRIPQERLERAGNVHWLNRLLYVDLKLAVSDNDLFKVNRMAESCGVQVRYPYLDKEVAAASARIPAKLKLKGWQKRYIFKKAFADLLPREILRKKKHGFGLPTGDWLRTDPGFRDLAHSLLLDARSRQRGYFKPGAMEELLRKHDAEPSNYYGSHIWNFMMLEMWHRNHFDRAAVK